MKTTKEKKETTVEENIDSTKENEVNGKAHVAKREYKSDFVPQRIGQPDLRREKEIINAYQKVIECACEYQLAISACISLDLTDDFSSFKLLIESLRTDTKEFLSRKYIEINKLSFPGLAIEKLIENDLISTNEISYAVEMRKALDDALKNAKNTGFSYPLDNLNSDWEIMWELSDDFLNEVKNHVSRFTQNEEQNNIFGIFERLTDVLNELNSLNILRAKNGVNEISSLKDYIKITRTDMEPHFEISSYLFNTHRLRGYLDKPKKKAIVPKSNIDIRNIRL